MTLSGYVYRVSFTLMSNGHRGYSYYSSRAEAERAVVAWAEEHKDDAGEAKIEDKQPQPRNRVELLNMLHRWGAHPDNG